ncbi:MAG: carboxylesterase/lipase family protein [Oscillospiraceae bacterium]|nr:carboxylesterase/lipase family protein [Oscillospiraceae bacterium]
MEKQYVCNEDYPVVETCYGKLRGYLYDGVFRFFGVKYADAQRFQMPNPIKKWDGIKNAHNFGYNCPGSLLPRPMSDNEMTEPHRYWPESEHCQYLNIWTSTLNPNAGKAVMVWLHPGAYVDGSGIEMTTFDGDNLVKLDDVICVTLNHRLNVLGFLDMSDYGPEYENSGNAGLADIVIALKWVRDNIRQFGGDPDNVTIFGQSGGGGKVSALMQVPSAEGLFQKAIIMSGIIPDDDILVRTTVPQQTLVEEIMKEIAPSAGLKELLTAPEIILERAVDRAHVNLLQKGYALGWGPRKNNWYLGSLCLNSCVEYSKKIPVIVGSTFAEFNYFQEYYDKNALSKKERCRIGGAVYGNLAEKYINIFHKAYPGFNEAYAPYVDTFFRKYSIDYVLNKAAVSEAPVFSYVFALEGSMFGGTIATHCSDIPFAFHNADRVPAWQVPGVSDYLCDVFSKMMTAFAKTGNPNIPELPEWIPSSSEHIETMVFGQNTTLMHDHDRQLIDFILKNKPLYIPDFKHTNDRVNIWKY